MAKQAKRNPNQPRERRNREAQVIDAAVDVFFRKGFSAASVQDVAEVVGVLKGSLYYYIDSKEDLLYQIFMESHKQSSFIVEEIVALDVPALERLYRYFERYVHWYLLNVERVSIYFSEWNHLTGARHKAVLEQRRHENDFVEGLVEGVKREGLATPDLNTKFAAFFIIGAVNGLPTWYRRNGPAKPEAIAKSFADMVLGTVCGSPPSMVAADLNGLGQPDQVVKPARRRRAAPASKR